MPVILATPYVPTVPEFDKVHLDALTVSLDKTNYAKTLIQARVRLYYQDPVTGNKTFSQETRDIVIDDAEAWAIALAGAGDNRGLLAAGYIKEIVALLVSTKTEFGNSTIS